jgi:hypothetical protein
VSTYGVITYGVSTYGVITYGLSTYGVITYGLSSYSLPKSPDGLFGMINLMGDLGQRNFEIFRVGNVLVSSSRSKVRLSDQLIHLFNHY